jgi:hypothetical protein
VTHTFKTALSPKTLETILTSACAHPFEIAFMGLEDTPGGAKKILRITFGSEKDHANFSLAIQRFAAKARAGML